MTVDLAALARLASEATPGPWDYWDLISWDEGTGEQAGMMRPAPYTTKANAAYIAAASPDVVAALVRVALAAKVSADRPWSVVDRRALRAALADLDR